MIDGDGSGLQVAGQVSDGQPTDKTALLAKSGLFSGLAGPVLGKLAARAHMRKYDAGTFVFRNGAPGDSMMVVAQGTVRISAMAPTARDVILTELGPGSVFGEIALLDGGGRSADAQALTRCEVLVLDRGALLSVMRGEPDLAAGLLQLLCARLRRAEERMMDFAFLQLPARLARTLLRLSSGGAAAASRLSLSQADLADMVGGSRENVNRCLRKWHNDGLIALKDGWIVLSDPPGLERVAQAD